MSAPVFRRGQLARGLGTYEIAEGRVLAIRGVDRIAYETFVALGEQRAPASDLWDVLLPRILPDATPEEIAAIENAEGMQLAAVAMGHAEVVLAALAAEGNASGVEATPPSPSTPATGSATSLPA